DRMGAGEVDRRFGGVVDAVEFGRPVGVVSHSSGDPKRWFAQGARRAGALAVGKAAARRLAHAPVVDEARGGEYRIAVFADFTAVAAYRARRGRRLAAVVGDPQADRVRTRRGIAVGDDRVAAAVRLIGAV